MKALWAFLSGFLLITMTVMMVVLGGAIYTAGDDIGIVPYFFQPNLSSARRIGYPATIDDYGPDKIRTMLIEKFVTEYFYAVPDMENITYRMSGNTAMRRLSTEAVFNNWVSTQAIEITELASKNAMRLVHISNIELPQDSVYWRVHYTLSTWMQPNDMFSGPTHVDGIIYVRVRYVPGLIQYTSAGTEFDVEKFLESGRDPSGVFNFRVIDVRGE